jgi:deazaflavin-dependent oxidoreductase (nitroreductase family)
MMVSLRRRVRNHVIILLHRIGLPAGPTQLLTVAGRTTGLARTTPVAPVTIDGVLYIVQAYPGSDWVKNVRVAGSGVLTRGRHRRSVVLTEIPRQQRGPILREFPRQNPRGSRAFLRNGLVRVASPDSFEAAAPLCPLFRATPAQ